MLLNRHLVCVAFIASISTSAMAQVMTVTEAALKQSDIARAEMDGRLEELRGKVTSLKSPVMAPAFADKDAEETLSLISVYGVGGKLKADFLFRGAVITLEPGGAKAAGWMVERLTHTEAVMVKKPGAQVTKRNTVYLSAAAVSLPAPLPTPSILPPIFPPVAVPASLPAQAAVASPATTAPAPSAIAGSATPR